MTSGNFTWSDRFPFDTGKIKDADFPKKKGIYSTYVVGPEEIVKAAGYVAGSEELVYVGAAWGKGGLRSRLGGRVRSIKSVLPDEDDSGSNLRLEEKRLIRLGLSLECAFISGATSKDEALLWEGLMTDEYKDSHDGRRPPGMTRNPPRSKKP